MKQILAVLVGKGIHHLSRVTKTGGGSAAPGLYALKVYPNLIEELIKNIPQNIIITGTNGKTTTAKMISQIAEHTGAKVIKNQTGSNLERGIASALISNSRLIGKKANFDLGVWELDEAAFNKIAPKLNPNFIIFLNAFRDQLDRYGEVDTVVNKWCETLKKINPSTTILVNGDDANTQKLARCFKGKALTFGVKSYQIKGESVGARKNLDYQAINIKHKAFLGTAFDVSFNHQLLTVNLPIAGTYNVYNSLAALITVAMLGIPLKKATGSLSGYTSAFGRMEKFTLTPPRGKLKQGYILLIKNPTGATEVLTTIAPVLKKDDRLLVALNDNFADGTDVSWIWDTQFEKLQSTYKGQLICSGIRAYDLALRLKYAGFSTDKLLVEPDLKKAFIKAKENLRGNLYILPTYTAMLELQKILTKSGVKKHYWEEK